MLPATFVDTYQATVFNFKTYEESDTNPSVVADFVVQSNFCTNTNFRHFLLAAELVDWYGEQQTTSAPSWNRNVVKYRYSIISGHLDSSSVSGAKQFVSFC